MPKSLSYTLAQINPTVGALADNVDKILNLWRDLESDLLILPELCITGYPPEDLVLKLSFIDEVERQVNRLCEESKSFKTGALISAPWRIKGEIYNAALLLDKGKIRGVVAKTNLPNYSVFDEKRIFKAGKLPAPIHYKGIRLGILICEDMWCPKPAKALKEQGAQILLVLNASPYSIQKQDQRLHYARARAEETHLPLIYVNQVGGQDELVFDGASFAIDDMGVLRYSSIYFEEEIADFNFDHAPISTSPSLDINEEIYKALCLSLKDYVTKNGFPGVILGLSGGIDSAIVATIATDALGADKVHCVMMPSRYTSNESLKDAQELVKYLGCSYETISIKETVQSIERALPDLDGIAAENIQSRSRALLLMALSNADNYMLLSTGNKSELSVGYATLYGDMCGGYNVLKDIYKTRVYELCRWRNKRSYVIPQNIIEKAPTAELKENQKDQDSLPEYQILDDILECLIEGEMSIDEICDKGHNKALVLRVWKMLDRAEYKRYQAPPGTVITERAFGRDRRYPLTNRFINYIEGKS